MNFNPNAIMKQRIQQMISQRFGSVDNMMNDMSKFAGNNPTLKNALDLYKHGDTEQLHQVQQNIFNRCCAQVTACGVRTRTKYATRVATSATGGAFKMLGNPACSPNNNLTAINGTAQTAENVVQAVKRGGIVNA